VSDATGSVNLTFCATLVDEWVRGGLTDAVVCPGSRSTPMALALATDGRVRIHVHHDERSGSFLALGLARATDRAVALLATSGTATVQFHAAVVEADLDRVPMLVLTADRPPELRGIGAPQTIDQIDLYGSSVRAFIDAGPPDSEQSAGWRGLARRALEGTTSGAPGPVQLNLPFREPLVGERLRLPPIDPVSEVLPTEALVSEADADHDEELDETADVISVIADLVGGRNGVIIAGGGVDDPSAVMELADALCWPVLADQRSGCRGLHPRVIAHGDAIVRVPSELLDTEVIIRLGAPVASKVISQWLAGTDADQVLVDSDGIWRDPEGRTETRVLRPIAQFCRDLCDQQVVAADARWCDLWRAADDAAESAIMATLSTQTTATEPGVARNVVAALPDGAAMVVSSSMPIRDLEWFGARREGVTVHANRGANGIDGVVSTAVGVAAAGAPTALLIGDVAFLHDTNGLLGLDARHLDLCIVVIDNDGGGIFSFLPQRSTLDVERFEQLFGTPHGVNITGLVNAHGLPVLEATDDDSVRAAVTATLSAGGTHVVLVRTNRDRNVQVHEELHAATGQAVTGALRGG
jgi:2-succinyl-5-enolpyruvyl-6-hydroxy-3-cyclohexene-1-carboxylate synthase